MSQNSIKLVSKEGESAVYTNGQSFIHLTGNSFSKICRSCLFGNAAENIFKNKYDDILLSTIYTTLYSVKLAENDGLPNHICEECMEHMKRFYSFRISVQNSENILQNVANQNALSFKKDEKVENVSDEDNNFNQLQAEEAKLKNNSTKTLAFVSCKICNKSVRKSRLVKHMRIHGKAKSIFQCETCGKNYSTQRNLKRHKLSHTGLPYICELCSKGFREPHLLKEHLNIHQGITPYLCSLCGKSYPTSSALRLHRRYTHQGIKPKVYKYRKVDNSSKPKKSKGSFPCEVCGKVYASRTIVNYHILTHSEEKKFQCNDCGKMFANKSILGDHRRVHRMSYKCNFCDRTFAYAASLETHVNSHTGAKPHACTVCDKRYSNKSHLREHMRHHTGERPYSCKYCGKTFAVRGNLNSHLKIHSKEFSNSCSNSHNEFSNEENFSK